MPNKPLHLTPGLTPLRSLAPAQVNADVRRLELARGQGYDRDRRL